MSSYYDSLRGPAEGIDPPDIGDEVMEFVEKIEAIIDAKSKQVSDGRKEGYKQE